MTETPEYVLLDQLSMNQLGEYETFEEAEAAYLRYLAQRPADIDRLEIWLGDTRLDVDPRKLPPATAA